MTPHPSRSVLRDHLDRKLAADDSSRVEEHLERCPECTTTLSSIVEEALGGPLRPAVEGLRAIRPVDVVTTARRRRPRRWLVAGAAAAVLLVSFAVLDVDPVNADVILDRLSSGPRHATSATYVVGSVVDGSRREVVYGGPRVLLARRRSDDDLQSVAVSRGAFGWEFDASSQRLVVATNGDVVEPELSLFNPFDAAGLVTYLREHCEVEFEGEILDDGVPSWVLACEPADGRGVKGRIVIDQVANIVRSISGERLARFGELKLLRTGDVLAEGDLLPSRYVTPQTKVSVNGVGNESIVAFVHSFAATELPPELASLIGAASPVSGSKLGGEGGALIEGMAAEMVRYFARSGRLETFVRAAGFEVPEPSDIVKAIEQSSIDLARGKGVPAGLAKVIDPKELRGIKGLADFCDILSESTGVPIELAAGTFPFVFLDLEDNEPMPAWALIKMLAAVYGLDARILDGKVRLEKK